MATYLVSYDLDKPGQDYHRLITELNRIGAKKVLYSEWLYSTAWSAVQLRDYLAKFVDSNDMLLIVALTGEAAWTQLMVSNAEVIKALAA
jgi:hypothetical protein